MEQSDRSFFASLAAMVGISLAFMLIALNTSVVGTAMPSIVADLSGYALYQWSASAFLVGNAVMIPITGRLGDLYGRKPFVLASVLLFALASIACGASQTMVQLVLARACQGLAGGMLLGVASACVPDLFPDEVQRVRWQVLLSAGYGIALAVGPWMGGWLTENVGWRYVFYINLPVALAALLMVWVYFPHIVHHEGLVAGGRSIDWMGALLLLLAMGGLLGAAEYSQLHGFANFRALGLWVGTSVLTYGFFRHQYHTAAPIVPPEILDNQGARKLMLLGMLTGLTPGQLWSVAAPGRGSDDAAVGVHHRWQHRQLASSTAPTARRAPDRLGPDGHHVELPSSDASRCDHAKRTAHGRVCPVRQQPRFSAAQPVSSNHGRGWAQPHGGGVGTGAVHPHDWQYGGRRRCQRASQQLL